MIPMASRLCGARPLCGGQALLLLRPLCGAQAPIADRLRYGVQVPPTMDRLHYGVRVPTADRLHCGAQPLSGAQALPSPSDLQPISYCNCSPLLMQDMPGLLEEMPGSFAGGVWSFGVGMHLTV